MRSLSNFLSKIWIALCWTTAVSAQTWDPNPETEIARYIISYGTTPGVYTSTVDVGLNTSATLTGLDEGKTYYAVVTAVNKSGVKGRPSVELSYKVPSSATIPENHPPVAVSQSLAVSEDLASPVNLVATDADEDFLSYSIVSPPLKGSLSGTAPNLIYTPSTDFSGTDSFTYKASDAYSDSNTALVSITISPVNDAPVAVAKSASTNEDVPVSIILSASDKEGSSLGYTIVASPTKGILSGIPPNLTYTPSADYTGTDSFTYKASDAYSDSNTALVSITISPVNDAPVAVAKSASTNEDVPVSIILSASDREGSSLGYTIVASPTKGILSGIPPNLTYTPSADYTGTDSFTYKASDGSSVSNTATVSITISPVNDVPVASPSSITTTQDTAVTFTLGATDKDGNSLTYSIVAGPSNGTISGSAPNLTYTPSTKFNGSDSLTFKANDGSANSNVAKVSIEVTRDDSMDDKVIGRAGWVLRYVDSEDAPGNPATLAFDGNPDTFWHTRWQSGATPPPHEIQIDLGKLHTLEGFRYLPRQDGFSVGNIGQYEFHTSINGSTWGAPVASGSFSNSPAEKEVLFAAVNARYIRLRGLTEASGGMHSSVAELNVLGTASINLPPTANPQNLTTAWGTALPIVLTGTDPENDSLAYDILSAPGNGALAGSAPELTYTPDKGFKGRDSFTFRAGDGSGYSQSVTISITVNPKETKSENRPPTFLASQIRRSDGAEGNPYRAESLDRSAADPDPGDSLTYTKVTGPAWLQISTDGTLSGTPDAGSEGSNRFSIRVTDRAGASDLAQLLIDIKPTSLPLPWEAEEIGEAGKKPQAAHQSGAFTIESSGTLSGSSDAGNFVWQTLSGDGEIIARVSSISNGEALTRAGVMIRDSLAANSKHVFIGVNGGGDFRWVRRNQKGNPAVAKTSGNGALPEAWIRLVRKGDTVIAYKSKDGSDWKRVGATTTGMRKNCYIGLSMSGGKGNAGSATFRNVKVKQ